MEKINLHKDFNIWELEKKNEKLIQDNELLKKNLNEKTKIINKFETAISKLNKEINSENKEKEEKEDSFDNSFEILELSKNEEEEDENDF